MVKGVGSTISSVTVGLAGFKNVVYSDEPELTIDVTVTLMVVDVELTWVEVEVELTWIEVEVDAVVPVVVGKPAIEVLVTLESVLVELMTLVEVVLVEGEVTPGIALVEFEIAGIEVTIEGVLVVLDNNEVMLDAIGVEEFVTKGVVKELAEPEGKTRIELLLPKIGKATVDEALDEDE